MSKQPGIPEEQLRACLQDQYELYPITLEFLPIGKDYNAGVYRVVNEQGRASLLKVTSRSLDEASCLVPHYLRNQGITSVVAPIPTRYTRWVCTFETQHLHARHDGSQSSRALRADWWAHQSTIHTGVTTLEKLAEMLQRRSGPYVICHADLHARNLIRNRAGQVFVIDWDEVMLAPKERDFLFVRPPHADAFFQGYGQVEIDWVALTYFLWERVVQDLIECTHNVCFRDDWAEETRAEAVQLLEVILAEDRGHIDAAYQASAHLPGDLTVHSRKSS